MEVISFLFVYSELGAPLMIHVIANSFPVWAYAAENLYSKSYLMLFLIQMFLVLCDDCFVMSIYITVHCLIMSFFQTMPFVYGSFTGPIIRLFLCRL